MDKKKLLKLLKREKKVTLDEPAILTKNSSFTVKESYKTLRTNLMFSIGAQKDSAKVITVASSLPGEGKTTTAINLAITFSELGSKVLVIDCDLRKPKLHKYLKLKNTVGMSTILGGFDEYKNCVITTEYGFDCITAGRIPPNPSELLSSDAMVSTLDALRQDYDFIFADCPPVDIVSDIITVASNTDGVLYVVTPDKAFVSDVAEGVSKFKFCNIKILGMVANAVSVVPKRKYGKKYEYYSKYRYYRSAYRSYEYKDKEGGKL